MKIKYILSIILLTGVIFACDAPKNKEVQEVKEPTMEKKEPVKMGATRFEELKGYFVKNNVEFDKAYKFVVVSSQDSFDKYFGIGKTIKNEVSSLDFDKFNVAGILLKPSDKAGRIQMKNYTAEGAIQIVNFTVDKGEDQSFSSGALMLFKIPKSRTSVDFVSGSTTVNVPVK